MDKGDVRERVSKASFDLVTLHDDIHYFDVAERPELLRQLKRFLVPGGRLLVTTGYRGGGPTVQALDIWSANTAGCGRLPGVGELEAQMRDAGFEEARSRRLMPGEGLFAFQGRA